MYIHACTYVERQNDCTLHIKGVGTLRGGVGCGGDDSSLPTVSCGWS